MRKFCLIMAALSVSALTAGNAAGDATEQCDSCHGAGGVSTDSAVPSIAGLSEFVIEDYMFVFQDDARPCRAEAFEGQDAADHCALAKLHDEDAIAELAVHYSAKDFVPAKQETDAAKVVRGGEVHAKACEKCHTEGGAVADDDASILAGQWMPYLEQSFADYQSGERDQPKSMKKKLDPLSAEDIDALVHFYGSVKE